MVLYPEGELLCRVGGIGLARASVAATEKDILTVVSPASPGSTDRYLTRHTGPTQFSRYTGRMKEGMKTGEGKKTKGETMKTSRFTVTIAFVVAFVVHLLDA